MEINTEIVITYNERKENGILECTVFTFEWYNGQYVIGSIIGEI